MKIQIELEAGDGEGIVQDGTHLEEITEKIVAMVNDHTLYSACVVNPVKIAPKLHEVVEDPEWWIKETITYLIKAPTKTQALTTWNNDPNDRAGAEVSREVECGFEI